MGVRISPLNSFNSMSDSDPVALATWLAKRLDGLHLAYLHVMRADLLGEQHADVLTPVRENFSGVLVSNMGYTAADASEAISSRKIDAVAFGRSFLANPDLPERIRAGAELNEPDAATFYSPGAAGYTDYKTLEESR